MREPLRDVLVWLTRAFCLAVGIYYVIVSGR